MDSLSINDIQTLSEIPTAFSGRNLLPEKYSVSLLSKIDISILSWKSEVILNFYVIFGLYIKLYVNLGNCEVTLNFYIISVDHRIPELN